MIPVDEELGRQYQLERIEEANCHRLLRQTATGGQPPLAHGVYSPIAKQLRMWIADVVGLAVRRAGTQFSTGITSGLRRPTINHDHVGWS
jgi:hypothetical protein